MAQALTENTQRLLGFSVSDLQACHRGQSAVTSGLDGNQHQEGP